MVGSISLESSVDWVLIPFGWQVNWTIGRGLARRGIYWIRICESGTKWSAIFYTVEKHADDVWFETGEVDEDDIIAAVKTWNAEVNMVLAHEL